MYKITKADKDEFKLLVTDIMDNWFGLQAAIEHGMGGTPAQTSSSLSRIVEEITDMCLLQKTEIGHLVDTLEERVDELFNTVFEDDSIDVIAEILWNHKNNFFSGNKESVRSHLASMQEKSCGKSFQRLSVSDDEMDTVDEESIPANASASSGPSYLPAEDPDGWTIPRHNRKRKN